jgi:hypothetical protein
VNAHRKPHPCFLSLLASARNSRTPISPMRCSPAQHSLRQSSRARDLITPCWTAPILRSRPEFSRGWRARMAWPLAFRRADAGGTPASPFLMPSRTNCSRDICTDQLPQHPADRPRRAFTCLPPPGSPFYRRLRAAPGHICRRSNQHSRVYIPAAMRSRPRRRSQKSGKALK